jgi:hypothetical protein
MNQIQQQSPGFALKHSVKLTVGTRRVITQFSWLEAKFRQSSVISSRESAGMVPILPTSRSAAVCNISQGHNAIHGAVSATDMYSVFGSSR